MIYNDLDHERGLDDLSDLFERALSAVEVRETKRQETRLSAKGTSEARERACIIKYHSCRHQGGAT